VPVRPSWQYDPVVTSIESELAALRSPLLAFCYQLLGSPFDAEDAVQDAMERALRSADSFDPELGSLSTWLYRIARNICFDRLRELPRRPLPRDLCEPGIDVSAPLVPAFDVPWLMPAPTRWWADSQPERAAIRADDIRLAVTAVLQSLPPKQRGVFILREVLSCSTLDTASILDMTVAAVNSALQRARAAVRSRTTRPVELRPHLVEQYARAIERADVTALASLVDADVLFEMPPVPQWSVGRETYSEFMANLFAWRGKAWSTRPISANGQSGFLLFVGTEDGWQPHTVQLFETDSGGKAITHVLVYQDQRLFALFENNFPEDR
jgi:RNA polymerase sigma-70 factor, ECF subfamily